MAKLKKHVALYNRVWEALHADDEFVVASDLTHEELVEKLAYAMLKASTRWRADHGGLGARDNWPVMAEAVLAALQNNEDDADFKRRAQTAAVNMLGEEYVRPFESDAEKDDAGWKRFRKHCEEILTCGSATPLGALESYEDGELAPGLGAASPPPDAITVEEMCQRFENRYGWWPSVWGIRKAKINAPGPDESGELA